MRLAVVGSVSLAGNAEADRLIEDALDRWAPTVVVSGGADGIDKMAVAAARRRGIDVCEYVPTRKAWGGPGGYKERNLKVARDCDALVRIVAADSKTYGSGWTRDRAAERGVPTETFVVQIAEAMCFTAAWIASVAALREASPVPTSRTECVPTSESMAQELSELEEMAFLVLQAKAEERYADPCPMCAATGCDGCNWTGKADPDFPSPLPPSPQRET